MMKEHRELLERGEDSYDVAVNAIGVLNKAADGDKASSVYLNDYLPHQLPRIAHRLGALVIQISTDCVFVGNTGPYDERSAPDGQTFYDRSKAIGELNNDRGLMLFGVCSLLHSRDWV